MNKLYTEYSIESVKGSFICFQHSKGTYRYKYVEEVQPRVNGCKMSVNVQYHRLIAYRRQRLVTSLPSCNILIPWSTTSHTYFLLSPNNLLLLICMSFSQHRQIETGLVAEILTLKTSITPWVSTVTVMLIAMRLNHKQHYLLQSDCAQILFSYRYGPKQNENIRGKGAS